MEEEQARRRHINFLEKMRFLHHTRMILIERFKQQRLKQIKIVNWYLSQLLKNSDSKGCEEVRNLLRWWDKKIWWFDYLRQNRCKPKLLGPGQTKNQEQFQEIEYGPEEVKKLRVFVGGLMRERLKKQIESGREPTLEEYLREMYEAFSQEERLVYESNMRRTAPRKVERLKRLRDFKQKILNRLNEMKQNKKI